MRFRILLLLAAVSAMAQTPRFDVASVKIWPKTTGGGMSVTPTSVRMDGTPLGVVIRWAYGLHTYPNYEIAGPSWLEPGLGCVRVQIEAKTDHAMPEQQMRLMMRTLLAERFQLAFHRESREQTACVISKAKDDPALHSSDAADMTVSPEGFGLLHFKGAQISRVYETLYAWIPYLILDETGLRGRYDFDLNIAPYLEAYSAPGPGGLVDGSGAVNKALQPLGLKLQLQKRPVEMLVIDHVEKTPVEN